MKPIEVSITNKTSGAMFVELWLEGGFLQDDLWRELTPKEARDLAAELLTAANKIDWIHMRKVVDDANKTD
jgi:hypothetical protein